RSPIDESIELRISQRSAEINASSRFDLDCHWFVSLAAYCREQPTSTFKLLAFGRLISFLGMSETLRGEPRAALRPRTEPCGSEKTLGGMLQVELTGIEPVASGLQSPRSPS